MTAFAENSLFLFVDDLADGSPNFAADVEIVELSDTGCDARTPGAALNITKGPDAIIEHGESTQSDIRSVRKSFSLSPRQDKNLAKKNTNHDGRVDARKNVGNTIAGARNSLIQRNLIDKVANKTGVNPPVRNRKDGKVIAEYEKAKPNSNRTWFSAKYSENNWTVNSKSMSSSIPKQYKAPEVGSNICSTFEGGAKQYLNKSATSPQTNSLNKASKVTSGASINHEIKKFVNRAVDKDSLSNCSRQLEITKTFRALSSSKPGYASRLPRSAAVVKIIAEHKPQPIGNGKETKIKPESKPAPKKISGRLWSRVTKVTESENMPKVIVETSQKLSLQRKPGDEVKVKLSTRTYDFGNPSTSTSSRSASKLPLPRNLSSSNKNVRSVVKPDEVTKMDQVPDDRKFKSNERLSLKTEKIDKTKCQDSGRVPARPSQKCHNLTPRDSAANNVTISFQTKFPKPRTPSIVPRLMNEFRLQGERQNKVSRCSSAGLEESSVPLDVRIGKLQTGSNTKTPSSSGIPSDQLNERSANFSDRLQEVLTSKIPLLSGVAECPGTNHRSRQSKSMTDDGSRLLSGVKGIIDEKDEEIELKTIFADTSSTASRKPSKKSSASIFGATKTKESKLRYSPLCPSTESKVPRPVVTKQVPRHEMRWNSSTRTWPKKQESLTPRRTSKNSNKTDVKKEPKPATPPMLKSVVHLPESKTDVPETSVDDAEDVIPIMNPATLCNVNSFTNHYPKRGNFQEKAKPWETVHGEKPKAWIEGHEQAYFKGRAIGLKVANMARAAKTDFKPELLRGGLKSTTPKSLPDKSQEIVDIGVSLIEKVLAERESEINSPSVRGDQASNYSDFEKNIKWNSRHWFM